MLRTISIEEAENCVEGLISDVEAGDEYVITRAGVPVARIVACHIGFGPLDRDAEQDHHGGE